MLGRDRRPAAPGMRRYPSRASRAGQASFPAGISPAAWRTNTIRERVEAGSWCAVA